jgi:predicted GIY-YIG superfamily endonuclease
MEKSEALKLEHTIKRLPAGKKISKIAELYAKKV